LNLIPTLTSVLVAIALIAIVSSSLIVTIKLLGLNRAAAVTAYFCGSQKSLANGLPVAQALFGSAPALGLIVMPLLVYHQIQLAVGSIAAKRMRGRTNDE
jgi:sodium/bile acid cotransporter 7